MPAAEAAGKLMRAVGRLNQAAALLEEGVKQVLDLLRKRGAI